MSLKEFDNTLVLHKKYHNTISPLNYPGGKSYAIKKLIKYIPCTTKEMTSPFFGGGSLEIVCAGMGIKVYGYDVFEELVEFWKCLLADTQKLASLVKPYYPSNKIDLYNIRKSHKYHPDKWERAAMFYVINKHTFGGATFSGGISIHKRRFTLSMINNLANFDANNNLSVDYMDFKESIPKSENVLLYCDPPYALDKPSLYGHKGELHKGFDHELLADILHSRDKWILSYNDAPYIRELYRGYQVQTPKWQYCMNQKVKSNEVLILSDDLKI